MLNLFFPVRIKNNYFISEKVVLLYINEYGFTAFLIYASGYKRIIKKQFFFEFANKENFQDESFMMSLISKATLNWTYDYVKIILSGNIAIFRSLYLPFSDIEKIKMTAPFELESLLPFQLSEASLDVMYQNKLTNNENNKILSVITKDIYIDFYKEIAKKLDIKIQSISVDAVEIVNNFLYYFQTQYNNYFVLYKNYNLYGLFLFSKDELLLVKYIDLSLYEENIDEYSSFLEKSLLFIGKECHVNLQEIPLYRIGNFDKTDLIQKIQEKNIFKVIYDFVFDSEDKVLVLEDKNDNILSKNNLFPIITKLYYQNIFFDLGGKGDNNGNNLLFKQIIVSFILSVFLYIFLFSFVFFDFYKIDKIITNNKKKIINFLKNEFKLNNKYTSDVDKAYNESKKIVFDLENSLPIPITHNKFLFINLFREITRAIPSSVKGLEFFEIRWKLGVEGALSGLSLLGRVADFDSLHNLEIALKNLNFFVSVPQQQDLNFNFNLIIASNEGV